MNRQLIRTLLIPLAFGLAACGSDGNGGPQSTPTAAPNATATAALTATAAPTGTAVVPPTGTATVARTATAPPTAAATDTPVQTPIPTPTTSPAAAAYPAQECVGAKQAAAGLYCQAALQAWAQFETSADTGARDTALQTAHDALASAWSAAEQSAQTAGTDCADLALQAAVAADIVDPAVGDTVAAVNGGLDLNNSAQAECGAVLLTAAAQRCAEFLAAEGNYVGHLAADPTAIHRLGNKVLAAQDFSNTWSTTVGAGCPTTATDASVAALIDGAVARLVLDTTVAPGVASDTYTTISPTGSTEYLGKTLTPVCMDGSPYHFFVKRGTVNKLVMYYQGGGACWEGLTCSIPTCDATVNPTGDDNPNGDSTGFADLNNPDNPFRDWHSVVVSYCSCDIHFGDAAQDYDTGNNDTLHVEHRGFHNASIAEKWAREHFVNPEMVFVTGSSAGAYGAWFNSVPLQRAYPASRFDVLADAGNGVITQEFLDGPFANWDFKKNLPSDIPGLREAIDDGTGIPGYTEAVATYFPRTNWAHYATAFDGGSGGQTGFYNIMLNDNFPLASLRWWQASCAFNSVMRQQVIATAAAVPSNYRYYIGTGSRHTMWGSNKVYSDTTGGVPTLVDWVNAFLNSSPGSPDPGWTNVECENCGLTLPGDPQPSPLEPPFMQVGSDVVIDCEP